MTLASNNSLGKSDTKLAVLKRKQQVKSLNFSVVNGINTGWLTGVLVAVSMTGCIAQGKSFSIDSNSRVPFFGLELSPNDRSTSNEIRSISQQKEKGRSWTDPFGTRAPRKDSLPRVPFPRTDQSPAGEIALEEPEATHF